MQCFTLAKIFGRTGDLNPHFRAQQNWLPEFFMPQCTCQGSDGLKALIQSPPCSPAQTASTTLPKEKPPAESQPPSPHPTEKTHTEPKRIPVQGPAARAWAVHPADGKACLPRS